jgi:hypothetical protein
MTTLEIRVHNGSVTFCVGGDAPAKEAAQATPSGALTGQHRVEAAPAAQHPTQSGSILPTPPPPPSQTEASGTAPQTAQEQAEVQKPKPVSTGASAPAVIVVGPVVFRLSGGNSSGGGNPPGEDTKTGGNPAGEDTKTGGNPAGEDTKSGGGPGGCAGVLVIGPVVVYGGSTFDEPAPVAANADELLRKKKPG